MFSELRAYLDKHQNLIIIPAAVSLLAACPAPAVRSPDTPGRGVHPTIRLGPYASRAEAIAAAAKVRHAVEITPLMVVK